LNKNEASVLMEVRDLFEGFSSFWW